MFIQVFEHVGFKVRSTPNLNDFKEGGEAKMMVHGEFSLKQKIKTAKQVF